jgi:hypothetical protein
VEVLELLAEAAAVIHPLACGLFQGAGDVQQNLLPLVPGGQVQGAVQLAFLAAAGGLAAGAGAFDQAAAKEGLLGEQPGEAGAGVPLWGGTLRSLAHVISSAVLTRYYTLRTNSADTSADECENALPRASTTKTRADRQLSTDHH